MGVIKGKPAIPAPSSKPVTSQATPLVFKPSVQSKPLADQSKPEPVPSATKGPNASVTPKKLRPGGI